MVRYRGPNASIGRQRLAGFFSRLFPKTKDIEVHVDSSGGWTTLDALRRSWVPHPLGVGFAKGAGFDSLGPPSFHSHISSFYLGVSYPAASKPLIIRD